jgi:hypothetical protein
MQAIDSNLEEAPIGVVTSGIPLPTDKPWHKPGSLAALFASMAVGDSVRLNKTVRDAVFVNAKAVGIRITTRSLDRETFRLWRLPDEPASKEAQP